MSDVIHNYELTILNRKFFWKTNHQVSTGTKNKNIYYSRFLKKRFFIRFRNLLIVYSTI